MDTANMDLELVNEQPIEETAFQLWALSCNRKPSAVVRALNELEITQFKGKDITPAKITYWSKQHEWPIKAKDLFEQKAPELAFETYSTLYGAAPRAASYLQSVIDGNYDPELSDEEKQRGYVPDPTMVRVRIEAATRLLHMVGYSPNGQNKPEKPVDPFRKLSTSDIKDLPMDQLLALEEEHAERIMEQNRERSEGYRGGRRATHT